MASAELGDIVRFYVDGASATALAIASESSIDLNYDLDLIDTSAKGDTVRTNTPGKVQITGNVSGLYVHTDAAQQRLITAMETGIQLTIRYYRSGSLYKYGTCQLTSLNLSWADNEAASYSASFTLDGAMTAA